MEILPSSIDAVFQSYGRCCKDDAFFESFYRIFLGKSQTIAERFDNTDMTAQRQLIRSGLMWLVLYARGMPSSKLEALGKSHGQDGYNIPVSWYAFWEDALIEAIRRHDEAFTPALEQQWREVIEPGIRLMQSLYKTTTTQVSPLTLTE